MTRGFKLDGTKLGFQKGNTYATLRKDTSRSIETRLKMSLSGKGNIHGFKKGELCGEKNPNWKNDATAKNHGIRWTGEYKKWRESVIAIYGNKCSLCHKESDKIEVDHIKPYSLFPDLVIQTNNGRVLCPNCHKRKTRLDSKFIYKKWPIELLEDVTQYVQS